VTIRTSIKVNFTFINMQRIRSRGQGLTELAIYLTVVVAAILTMRLYMQRSLKAKYKAGADYLITEIEQNAADKGIAGLTNIKHQYDPYYRESNTSEIKTGESSVGFPETLINQTVSRTGWEKTNSASDAD